MTEHASTEEPIGEKLSLEEFSAEVLADYQLAITSREMSLLGRKEVLTGKAKFGIFGDGKELPQIALAKSFQLGDWRSGYYRDQTWMMAMGQLTIEQFFAQLYANPDENQEVFSGGRQMNGHFATPTIDKKGNWLNQTNTKNSSADASPTASQLPRALGLALASKLYRANQEWTDFSNFSEKGNEISFVSIGDASTSEGLFWESVNAAAVMRVPLAVNVWDDGYGISVPKKYQTTKSSISDALRGFETNEAGEGMDIYTCEGWNYPKLVQLYKEGTARMRQSHRPALFHITEVTQPQGHSTSGSHERYKSAERLQWEKDFDGIKKMRAWILENNLSTEDVLANLEANAKQAVLEGKNAAWKNFITPIQAELNELIGFLEEIQKETGDDKTAETIQSLTRIKDPIRKDIIQVAKSELLYFKGLQCPAIHALQSWLADFIKKYQTIYSSHLHSESAQNALQVKEIKATFSPESKVMNGFEILNNLFDYLFQTRPDVVAFGEDVGKIGDVNQGFSGIQEKYGKNRIFDTGIREATIMGQALGLAVRGFRPIAEIQYLDYLLYGLQPLSDDLACLQYRTKGQQKAPLIVRTRGHRLEGIWHTGSPMGMIINSLRGMYVCVPRNMVQAAGMYNTLLQSDEPALLIECLNGYRLKETLPDNYTSFTVPLGVPEVLIQGTDVTLVTYGSCVRIADEAAANLLDMGISVELIDVQTLLPFDIHHSILDSVKKTNRIVFLDEDVPGGAAAYMFQQVFENQSIFPYLDSPPKTISAKAHRASFGTDGDYFSKPSVEEVFEVIYTMMQEVSPADFPSYL